MKRYLLDSGIAGDYINRRHRVYERARQAVADGHKIGIATPVLAELHYGVEYSNSPECNRLLLRRALSDLILWPLTVEATERYGQIRAELRRAGRMIQSVDAMIAAIALTLTRCTVVSADSDFSAVPGLSVENWAV